MTTSTVLYYIENEVSESFDKETICLTRCYTQYSVGFGFLHWVMG